MEISNSELKTVTKALLTYAQKLEQKVIRLEKINEGNKKQKGIAPGIAMGIALEPGRNRIGSI